jgi:LPXTG-motif cell wall-anchored protein
MRSLVGAIVATIAIAVGGAAVVAQNPYFGAPSVSVDPSTVAPGGAVTVTVQNCDAGSTVTITLVSSSVAVPCVADGPVAQGFRAPRQSPQPGTATGVVDAPTDTGTYTGSASGTSDATPFDLPFQVAVELPTASTAADGQDALPATGSSGVEPLTMAAIALVVVGGGLVIVAQIRRRQGSRTS